MLVKSRKMTARWGWGWIGRWALHGLAWCLLASGARESAAAGDRGGGIQPTAGSAAASGEAVYRDIVIADSMKRNLFFGLYRASQMTGAGWTLFDNSVSWVNSNRNPSTTAVYLATYNGTLDPDSHPSERDGVAVYNRLIDVLGFLPQNITVGSQETIETGNFSAVDIVIYAHTFPHNAMNVLNQGKPYLTFSAGQTDEMGIGTGAVTMHESRDYFYILSNHHPITEQFPIGRVDLNQPMFMDAAQTAGNGTILVTAEDDYIPCSAMKKLKAKCKKKTKMVVVTITLNTPVFNGGRICIIINGCPKYPTVVGSSARDDKTGAPGVNDVQMPRCPQFNKTATCGP